MKSQSYQIPEINQIVLYFRNQIKSSLLFKFTILFFIYTIGVNILHFNGTLKGNSLTWIFWLLSMLTMILSFNPPKQWSKYRLRTIDKTMLVLIAFTTIMYFVSHLINFKIAPWNTYGLFDDAAWDIYFSKDKIFSSAPFQLAFFDNVGYISREVMFHYYITIFFKLLGYNLLVFNIALMILGYITVLFTTMVVHKLFNKVTVSILSAIIINFFPLQFSLTFMGHRYAIAAPLMMISYYFTITALQKKSFFRISLGAIFAALCVSGAVTGKQYVYGLVVVVILSLLFNFKRTLTKENIALSFQFVFALIVSLTPLLIYIAFNKDVYMVREQNLTKEFLGHFKESGLSGIQPYINYLKDCFFSPFTYRRQFLADSLAIPLSYYLLLTPGLIIAFVRKRFDIIVFSTLPVFGAFLSGCYDYRIIICVPAWVMAIAMTLDTCSRKSYATSMTNTTKISAYDKYKAFTLEVICVFIISIGLVPSITYLWNLSKDPNHLYLLPHQDVAVSRVFQDIVMGKENPSIAMKWNEFNIKVNPNELPYDTLICPKGAYAIGHLYLKDFDDKKILAFCNQGIQKLKEPSEILADNLAALNNYQANGKDLKLVWEVTEKTRDIVHTFSKFKKFGSEQRLAYQIDSNKIDIYILTIKYENINAFKNDVKNL